MLRSVELILCLSTSLAFVALPQDSSFVPLTLGDDCRALGSCRGLHDSPKSWLACRTSYTRPR